MEESGLIRRMKKREREIEVIRMKDQIDKGIRKKKKLEKSVIEGRIGKVD